MEAQEVFDQVVGHLRKQGAKAQSTSKVMPNDLFCVYRTKDGKSCAVGCLIRDDEYSPEMEQHPLKELLDLPDHICPSSLKERLMPNERLLARLQNCHDYSPIQDWEKCFSSIALEFNLEYSPPEGETQPNT